MELLVFLANFIKEVLLKNKKLNPKSKEFKLLEFIFYIMLAGSLYTNMYLVGKVYHLGVKIYKIESLCKK